MKHTSSRFCGWCIVAGVLLCLIMLVVLHLLRPDYNPLRNFLSEYAVGPLGFVLTAALYVLAATFIMLLVGLRLSVRASGYLAASCVLLVVVAISVCMCAIFPIGFVVIPLDGSRPDRAAVLAALTGTDIMHCVASALAWASFIAVAFTLPIAYKRDERWRSFSQPALFLGFLFLAFFAGLILAPYYLRGLAQRGMLLTILLWLLLTGLRLRGVQDGKK